MADQRTVDEPKRLPLLTKLQSRSPIKFSSFGKPIVTDSHLSNGFAEYDPDDQQYWVYKRPGLGPTPVYSQQVFTGVARGIYQPTIPPTGGLGFIFGTVLFVTGGALNQGSTLIATGLDNTGGANSTYKFTTMATNPASVPFGTATAQYVYTPSTQALQTINPPNTDNLVPGVVALDNTIYWMDVDGNIWGSNLGDPTTYNALNVIPANSEADAGIALAKQLNYLIAFKQNSTQVFFDNQNPAPGSPLSPVPDSQIPLGCAAAYTVQAIDNSLLWMTGNETVAAQIVQMDNLVPKIVSTPAVERIIQNYQLNSNSVGVYAWVLKIEGHRFYGLTIENLNITLVYDMDQLLWYFWTDALGNFWPIAGTSYTAPFSSDPGVHLMQHRFDSNIYQCLGQDQFATDYGTLIPVEIYTPNFDGQVDRKKLLNLMRFNADKVPGCLLQVRYNDDDYTSSSWSNFRTVDLGKRRPFLANLGSFYRRAFHMRHRQNGRLRIKTVDLQLGIGVL